MEHHVRPRDREIEDTQSPMLTQRASRPTRTRGMVNDGKDQYSDCIKEKWKPDPDARETSGQPLPTVLPTTEGQQSLLHLIL